jgi:RNA polymerase sigma factor (sigma-70 family)
MATSQISDVIQHLRTHLWEGASLTDGQLLKEYISHREEAALAALVRRHGPMVWGVCRRVLSNHHDTEDAFQATFLVLVRKAASIASPERVANWLYGVAHQTALKARAMTAKRKVRERQVTPMPEPAVTGRDLWNDLQPLLDQELSRLPERYRVAIVLCELEGKTRKQAARQLGVPEGTLAARLARGRVMLSKRLARHGLHVSGGALAAILAQSAASAGVPNAVMVTTLKAASLFAAGQTAATGVISAKAAVLTEGVLKTMLSTKLKKVFALIAVLGLVTFGGGILTQQTAGAQRGPFEKTSERLQKEDATQTDQIPKEDLAGVWAVVSVKDNERNILDFDPIFSHAANAQAPIRNARLTLLGGKFTLKSGLVSLEGTYAVDPSATPKTITLSTTESGGVLAMPGAYSLERDELTITFGRLPASLVAGLAGKEPGVCYTLRREPLPKKNADDPKYRALSHDEIRALEFRRSGIDSLERGLQELGKQGWELVAIEPPMRGPASPIGDRPALYVFKRQKN